MNRKLRLGFLNFWENANLFYNLHFIKPLELKNIKCIIVDPYQEESDIIFISCFKKYNPENIKGNPILIWYTGENEKRRILNKNLCQYTLTFNPDTKTNLQYPLWALELKKLKYKQKNKNINKTKFCTFIVSNIYSNYRRSIFNYISETYKKIDSIGKGLNNTNYILPLDNFEYPAQYKFNLCFENSKDDYYITEKIIHAYSYNTIPIYYGGKYIENFFNPNSFINCNGLSKEEILYVIKEIDNNDKLYKEILNSSPFKENINYYEYYHNKFANFILSII